MNVNKKICVIGAGAIGTALAHEMATNSMLQVSLWSIEQAVIADIQEKRINTKYFPKIKLHKAIQATTNDGCMLHADVIFLAIPSVAVLGFVQEKMKIINPEAIIVNLAKGFCPQNRLITDCLKSISNNPIVTMKGPSFARDLINNQPTAFTLGSDDNVHFQLFDAIFRDTCIYIDHTTDIRGVELASILKNIYAIAIGIVDANFDSPNLRSLVLTRAMNEMRRLLIRFGGQESTMFNYCGFGDFTLTALNDLSRNRTLGLLIGKGFFTADISQKVVLEGRIAVNVFVDELLAGVDISQDYPIMAELHKVFNADYDVSVYISKILNGN
jgi:glycerol-3-phosphate dehydrogenase (NAD(P)+)